MTYWYSNFTIDDIKNFLTPIAEDIATKTGCSLEWYEDKTFSHATHYCLYYMGKYIGSIYLSSKENCAKFSLYTKITFTMKSTFTKTAMRHHIDIKLGVVRQVEDKNKYIDWLKLICKQYKTALAKKKKFEVDTYFE